MAVSALYAVTNETTISGATGVQIYLRNYSYANLALSMPRLSIGLATDNNRLVYKNSAGTMYKLLTDASGASNAAPGRIFYSDANGAATSGAGLTYDGSTLDVNGLAKADSARVSDLRVGDSLIVKEVVASGRLKGTDIDVSDSVKGATGAFSGTVAVGGDLVGIKSTGFTLRTNTADGADNKYLLLFGGGGIGTSRGAEIGLYGNEHALSGNLVLEAGVGNGTTTGAIYANPRMYFGTRPGNDYMWQLACNNSFTIYGDVTSGYINSNCYYNSGWKYRENGAASMISPTTNGLIRIYTAGTGVKDGTITWKSTIAIDTNGTGINKTPTAPLDVAGLAKADSARVSDLRVGDSTIGNYAIFEKSIKTDTFTVKYGIVGEGDWTRQLKYRTNTVDGSDNKGIGLYSYGDGMHGFGRGAYIEAYGNEYGEFRGGDIDIVAGEGSGTDVGNVHIRSNNGTISLDAELGVNVNNKLDVAGLAKADSASVSDLRVGKVKLRDTLQLGNSTPMKADRFYVDSSYYCQVGGFTGTVLAKVRFTKIGNIVTLSFGNDFGTDTTPPIVANGSGIHGTSNSDFITIPIPSIITPDTTGTIGNINNPNASFEQFVPFSMVTTTNGVDGKPGYEYRATIKANTNYIKITNVEAALPTSGDKGWYEQAFATITYSLSLK
jgi:hypothetical protein